MAYIRGGPQDESGLEMADAAMKVLGVLLEANGGPDVQFVQVAAGAHCVAQDGQPMPRESLAKILELGVVFKAPTKSMEALLKLLGAADLIQKRRSPTVTRRRPR